MKTRSLFLFILITAAAFAQTQTEINYNALQEYKAADLKLNNVYKKVLADHRTDTAFVQNLKKTQRIWIQLRDAQLKMKYPPKNEPSYYKSALPMLQSSFLTEFTIQRINELEGLIGKSSMVKNLWSGMWYGSNSRESSLSIMEMENNTYVLLCKGPNGEWEGIAYEFGNELISLFRYKNINEKGYFTLTLRTPGRGDFTTYNSNGSYRANGALVKE